MTSTILVWCSTDWSREPHQKLGFICNCLSYFTTAKISFSSILYPQFTHVILIIYIYFTPNHIQLFHCTVLNISCHHLLSIRVQTMENCMWFVFYNKPKSANEWASGCVAWQLTSALCTCSLIDNSREPIRNEHSGFFVVETEFHSLPCPEMYKNIFVIPESGWPVISTVCQFGLITLSIFVWLWEQIKTPPWFKAQLRVEYFRENGKQVNCSHSHQRWIVCHILRSRN